MKNLVRGFLLGVLVTASCLLLAPWGSGVKGNVYWHSNSGTLAASHSQGCEAAESPIQTEVHVYNPATNSLIASVKSAEDGRFQLNLPPGQYQLKTDMVCGGSMSAYVLVTVHPLLFTEVTLDVYGIAGSAQGGG
ncbi:MAG: hypothetical protein M3Z28_06490 [Candidatus Dormibacteraeota bacterium]|nr:hypothetical protein [Candidatus Dormibacteraeota bacterium]